MTIYVGVTLAAKLKDGRAYVGAVWFIPNIIGVLLINLLPWSNKVGLLFGQWTTGKCLIHAVSCARKAEALPGVGTTGFVLSLSWLSSVTAGHTKRVTTNAIMLIAYCVGNAAAPFMWQAKYQPRCVSPALRIFPALMTALCAAGTTFPGRSSASATSCALR